MNQLFNPAAQIDIQALLGLGPIIEMLDEAVGAMEIEAIPNEALRIEEPAAEDDDMMDVDLPDDAVFFEENVAQQNRNLLPQFNALVIEVLPPNAPMVGNVVDRDPIIEEPEEDRENPHFHRQRNPV